jgi:ParB family chromosome partitioning protein
MSTKDKYGNIDNLLSESSGSQEGKKNPSARLRRPSPALGAMVGDSRPTMVTDGLKADKQKAEQALEEAKKRFEIEKADLLQELSEVKGKGRSPEPIVLTMPVTKQEIHFRLQRVDSDLIDVSPENERIQLFLDEISLQDILPSIKKHGQQKPGTLRPINGGRFELIEGSRRLAAVKLAGEPYLALVGDVPDADVRELGVIENKHQDVSPYEKAKAFQRQIQIGEFENWTQLGAAKGISSSHIARYKTCVELDEIFVRILPSPSDMLLSYGEMILQLKKKDKSALLVKAEELLASRSAALENKTQLLDVEDVIKLLKSAVRVKTAIPKVKKPVVYKSFNQKVRVKHSMSNQGAIKFEVSGVDEAQNNKLLKSILTVLKIDFES